jgi:peptidoglycan/xylan/chitin deacetylase (PgdA/CDA1 family)
MKTWFSPLTMLVLATAISAVPVLKAADSAAPRRVALIFDDGPVPAQTEKFIALLAQEKVRVTFAYVGRNVVDNPGLARAAVLAGHEIVNHSYTHPHFKELDDATIEREVRDTQLAVEKATGTQPKWFWAPFGDWDDRIAAAVRAGGLDPIPGARVHFISSDDWNRETSAAEIRRRATTGVRDKTLIICHEWREETLAELPAILAELRRQGCEFVTFSELAALAKE